MLHICEHIDFTAIRIIFVTITIAFVAGTGGQTAIHWGTSRIRSTLPCVLHNGVATSFLRIARISGTRIVIVTIHIRCLANAIRATFLSGACVPVIIATRIIWKKLTHPICGITAIHKATFGKAIVANNISTQVLGARSLITDRSRCISGSRILFSR